MTDVKVGHCPTCEVPIVAVVDGKAYDLVPLVGDDE